MYFSLCFFNHLYFHWQAMEIWRLALCDYKLWPSPEEDNFVTWTYHLFQQSLGVGRYGLKPLCQAAVVFTQHRAWVWPVHPHHFKRIVPANIIQDRAWVWSVHSHHFKPILSGKNQNRAWVQPVHLTTSNTLFLQTSNRTGPQYDLSTPTTSKLFFLQTSQGQGLSATCPPHHLQGIVPANILQDRASVWSVHSHHFKPILSANIIRTGPEQNLKHPHHFKQHTTHGECMCVDTMFRGICLASVFSFY